MVDERGQARSNEPSAGSASILESVIVERDDGPTRCTIYPSEVPECEQTTTWLSADLAAFVSLGDAR